MGGGETLPQEAEGGSSKGPDPPDFLPPPLQLLGPCSLYYDVTQLAMVEWSVAVGWGSSDGLSVSAGGWVIAFHHVG